MPESLWWLRVWCLWVTGVCSRLSAAHPPCHRMPRVTTGDQGGRMGPGSPVTLPAHYQRSGSQMVSPSQGITPHHHQRDRSWPRSDKSVTVSSNYFNCNWLFRFTPHYRGGVLEIRNRPIIFLACIRISNTEVLRKRHESVLWKLSKDTDVSWEPRDYSQLTLEFCHLPQFTTFGWKTLKLI